MKKILVTGSNRGIGLELCRQLADQGHDVYAACRKASRELSAVTDHVIEGIDVARDDTVKKLSTALKDIKLDAVINCAGKLTSESLQDLDFEVLDALFQVNALGPLRVVKAVKDNLIKGSKIIMITSRMGSIADNTSGGYYAYRMSKTALNSASKSLALDLADRGIAVGIVHPGYVRTEMTGYSGHIEPAEAAKGIVERLEALNMENTGTFWHQNGDILPW